MSVKLVNTDATVEQVVSQKDWPTVNPSLNRCWPANMAKARILMMSGPKIYVPHGEKNEDENSP
jgi:hypothetical protein